ncbi:hypothetical protein DL96DRAFT_1520490 [Flagelloscypha sp. PMI_526]|nr:hypothetical protein DL96DRAFT_1520490 [Flagelloscypha sp. PMI_526]
MVSDASSSKLTKKQKKALSFRERKTKGRPNNEDNDIPTRDLLEDDAAWEDEEPQPPIPEPSSKKRKRVVEKEEEDVAADVQQPAKPPKKKQKAEEGVAKPKERTSPEKKRFILFLGNLKYTTSLEAIQEHFSQCDPPPKVRLLTPKPTPGKTVIKSKGCAFLEFSHRNALQQGLKLHHSQLDGRVVNVELTAGGGGKGEARLQKLTERNKGLISQRKKQETRAQKKDGEPSGSAVPHKTQRFSSTSGAERTPAGRKTWTVGDTVQDGPTQRGGKRHSKPSKKSRRPEGTGMNAIPLGAW